MVWTPIAELKSTVPGPQGDQGIPGVNGVENATAIASYITDPASNPTKDALFSTFGLKFQVDVTAYGAVADWDGSTGTDNLAAFNAALADCAPGARLFVPPGRYYMSDTFVVDTCVDLDCGRGGFDTAQGGTELVFAAGKTGIWVKENGVGDKPSGWRVGPLLLTSLSTAAGTDIGLLATNGQGTLDFTSAQKFGSHGFAFLAGANSPYTSGNVNNSYLNRPRAYGNRGDGILIQGNDAQALIVIKSDTVANYGWGVNVDRTAQNVIIAPHADQTSNSTVGAYRDNGSSNRWEQPYSEGGQSFTIDTNSSYATVLTSNYARPVITDLSAGKSALRVDVEQGTFKQIGITGVGASLAFLDVDQFATGVVRLRLSAPSSKDIFMYANGSGTFSINAPIRVNGTAAATPQVTSGAGTPLGVVSAPPGSLFLRTDGGANTSLYVKETGTGTSGWVAK